MQVVASKPPRVLDRALIGVIVLLVLIVLGAEIAHSAELLPSMGFARPANGGSAKVYTGIAMRSSFVPFIQQEIGVAYRREDVSSVSGASATTWPVTASLWFAPIPFLYAGGGVGWYHTSFSYAGAPAAASLASTQQSFGTHVGGGLRMPLAPMLGLDLNARYVVLQKKNDATIPSGYDSKFSSVALGLGVKF